MQQCKHLYDDKAKKALHATALPKGRWKISPIKHLKLIDRYKVNRNLTIGLKKVLVAH